MTPGDLTMILGKSKDWRSLMGRKFLHFVVVIFRECARFASHACQGVVPRNTNFSWISGTCIA